MWLEKLLTIILLVYAFIGLALANQVVSPFLAPVLIFFVWRIHSLSKQNNRLSEDLSKIKKMLEKLTDEKEDQDETKED